MRRDRAKQLKFVPREQRTMASREGICTTKHCKSCNTISDNDRVRAFESFWKMTWEQRKVYVSSVVSCCAVVRRKRHAGARRNNSWFVTL